MIKAIIFDMDGVISDTQKIHSKMESDALAQHGVIISPEEITKKYSGIRFAEFAQELLDKQGIKADAQIIAQDKRVKMIDFVKKTGAEPIAGAVELIKELYKQGFTLAVASTSTLALIEVILKQLKIRELFKIITSGHEVEHGKPAPDVFLLAAQRLSIDPQNCLVIEDALAGVEAANNAGMKSIGFVTDKNIKWRADILVTDLRDVDIDQINEL